MRSFLWSLLVWMPLWWGLLLLVYAYTGEWPDQWALLAALCFGFAWGARRLVTRG